jgi:hypothetical protein
MKEDITGFEVAKLAAEKGFDWKTKHWYDQTGTLNPTKGMRGSMSYERVAYAPSQFLLQKWLREVHNIHITVNFHSHPQLEKDWYEMWISSKHNDFRGHNLLLMKRIEARAKKVNWLDSPEEYGMFPTHQQALESGLLYSLNLITCLKDTITDNTHT